MNTAKSVAVWLYGSHARGDSDAISDVDVFVAAPKGISERAVHSVLPSEYGGSSITRYDWHEVREMTTYGSLFLQHIRLEGRPLYESRGCRGSLAKMLEGLGPYIQAGRDISGFKTVLRDVCDSMERGGTPVFELAVVATIIRHSSILGCWLINQPSFRRVEPVRKFVSEMGLPRCVADEFSALYCFRLYVDGRLSKGELPRITGVHEWTDRAHSVVSKVEELSHG